METPAKHIVSLIRSATDDELDYLLERYGDDPRRQVRHALGQAEKARGELRAERERVALLYARQRELAGNGLVVGVDEVGRGAVAGPLTVCAVCLPDEPHILGINDSKKLTPRKREQVCAAVKEHALAIGICHIPPETIDAAGMARALRMAMAGAIEDTGIDPDCVLIDGNPVHVHPKEVCVVHGDATCASIAAASIVAKVTRDAIMRELDSAYPGYAFADSKGYASTDHIAQIKRAGLTPVHRATFCGNFVEAPRLF